MRPLSETPVTYGRNLRSLAFDGFALNETLHGSGFGLPTHTHANPTIAFVLEGEDWPARAD